MDIAFKNWSHRGGNACWTVCMVEDAPWIMSTDVSLSNIVWSSKQTRDIVDSVFKHFVFCIQSLFGITKYLMSVQTDRDLLTQLKYVWWSKSCNKHYFVLKSYFESNDVSVLHSTCRSVGVSRDRGSIEIGS